MGFDAKAKVIMGVKLTHKVDKKTRVKYNENTGEPYDHVDEVPAFYIGGQIFSEERGLYDEFEENLHVADHNNKDTFFVGFPVTETAYANCGSDGKHYSTVEQVDKINARKQCEKYLEENGFVIEPGMINEYLIHYLSY